MRSGPGSRRTATSCRKRSRSYRGIRFHFARQSSPPCRPTYESRSGEHPAPAGLPVEAAAEDLCYVSAIELVSRIRRKQISARDVMTAHLARIERVNPKVNAIVTLVAERAMADATRADEATTRG